MSQELPQIEQDRLLARRVAGGDQGAFDEFFREYFPRLFRFTLTRADNDPELAEEVVQRTMCIVVRKMGSYRGDDFLPESVQQRDEIAGFVRTTLEHLPAKYAIALEMKYIHGNSVAEIAARLGVGEKAAESVLSRARSAFKEGFRSLWDFEPGFVVD